MPKFPYARATIPSFAAAISSRPPRVLETALTTTIACPVPLAESILNAKS